MSLTWTRAADALPPERELVLLYLPAYRQKRPTIATLHKGDPDRDGDYYRRDKWMIHGGFVSTTQYVMPDQQWAPIPTPASVEAWSSVLLPEPPIDPGAEAEPETPPAPPPAQPVLFEVTP